MFERDVTGIILAAGYKNRFREPKELLRLGDSNVLERATESLLLAGVYDILLVSGERRGEIMRDYLYWGDVRDIPASGAELSAAVKTGVSAVSPDCAAVLLMPSDCAAAPRTVSLLIEAFRDGRSSDKVIRPVFDGRSSDKVIRPVFDGRPGYPVLIPSKKIPEILSGGDYSAEGFEGALAALDDDPAHIPSEDEGCALRIDVMPDYYFLERFSKSYDGSDAAAANLLLDGADIPEHIKAHCCFVTKVSGIIADELYTRRVRLNRDALACAALLHDIKRLEPRHALAGKRFALDNGLPGAGAIIGAHMGYGIDGRNLKEKEVLFIADKYAFEDVLVSMERRFEKTTEKFSDNPGALEHINESRLAARSVKANIERLIGQPLGAFLKRRLERDAAV